MHEDAANPFLPNSQGPAAAFTADMDADAGAAAAATVTVPPSWPPAWEASRLPL